MMRPRCGQLRRHDWSPIVLSTDIVESALGEGRAPTRPERPLAIWPCALVSTAPLRWRRLLPLADIRGTQARDPFRSPLTVECRPTPRISCEARLNEEKATLDTYLQDLRALSAASACWAARPTTLVDRRRRLRTPCGGMMPDERCNPQGCCRRLWPRNRPHFQMAARPELAALRALRLRARAKEEPA